MKNCPKCQVAVSDTAKFCVKCGFNIKKYEDEQAQELFCPECGTKFSGGTFCPECGYNAAGDLIGEAAPKVDAYDDSWLSDIEGDTTADVTAAVEDKLRAERAKPLSAFEYEEHSDGTFTITGLKDKSAPVVNIPSCVVSIGESAFEGSEIVSVTLPDGIIKIGDRAFKDSADLMKINFPESLISVGDEAFAGCEMLDVELPETVIKIGVDAMKDTAPDKRKQAELAKWEIGANPTFGSYPQKNKDVKEPIEWIVLDRSGDDALLISKYVLDARKYDSDTHLWTNSSLKKWVEKTFMDMAFDDEDKKSITNSGAFLLSDDMVSKYSGLLTSSVPTAYAKASGAEVDANSNAKYWLTSYYSDKYGSKYYYYPRYAIANSVSSTDCYNVAGVRPAIWVNVK